MKKFVIVMIAAVMAFAFSAFTHEKEKPAPYYWHNGTNFVQYTGSEACPEGSMTNCIVTDVGDGSEQLYKTQSFANPLKYD